MRILVLVVEGVGAWCATSMPRPRLDQVLWRPEESSALQGAGLPCLVRWEDPDGQRWCALVHSALGMVWFVEAHLWMSDDGTVGVPAAWAFGVGSKAEIGWHAELLPPRKLWLQVSSNDEYVWLRQLDAEGAPVGPVWRVRTAEVVRKELVVDSGEPPQADPCPARGVSLAAGPMEWARWFVEPLTAEVEGNLLFPAEAEGNVAGVATRTATQSREAVRDAAGGPVRVPVPNSTAPPVSDAGLAGEAVLRPVVHDAPAAISLAAIVAERGQPAAQLIYADPPTTDLSQGGEASLRKVVSTLWPPTLEGTPLSPPRPARPETVARPVREVALPPTSSAPQEGSGPVAAAAMVLPTPPLSRAPAVTAAGVWSVLADSTERRGERPEYSRGVVRHLQPVQMSALPQTARDPAQTDFHTTPLRSGDAQPVASVSPIAVLGPGPRIVSSRLLAPPPLPPHRVTPPHLLVPLAVGAAGSGLPRSSHETPIDAVSSVPAFVDVSMSVVLRGQWRNQLEADSAVPASKEVPAPGGLEGGRDRPLLTAAVVPPAAPAPASGAPGRSRNSTSETASLVPSAVEAPRRGALRWSLPPPSDVASTLPSTAEVPIGWGRNRLQGGPPAASSAPAVQLRRSAPDIQAARSVPRDVKAAAEVASPLVRAPLPTPPKPELVALPAKVGPISVELRGSQPRRRAAVGTLIDQGPSPWRPR